MYEALPITVEDVLKQITQEEIVKIIMGYYPDKHKYYRNPFRKVFNADNNPGCFYDYFKGKLQFIDFADSVTHRDCFDLVSEAYGVDYQSAINIIHEMVNEGVEQSAPLSIYRSLSQPKQELDLVIESREFLLKDKWFWEDRYEISKSNLEEDETVAVKRFSFFSRRKNKIITIEPKGRCYAIKVNNHQKIYNPDNPKYKWPVSNCTKNDIGGWNGLPEYTEQLIITKSYKDWRVLKNQGYTTVWFQSEKTIPGISKLKELVKRSKMIYILYDNDTPGIEGALKLFDVLHHLGADVITIKLPGEEKDVSDFIEAYDRETLKQLLNELTVSNTQVMGTAP